MSGEKAPRKQSFLQGVAVLTAATIIVKLLGFIYKVPLQNILQERGFGYFNTAYDVYNVLLMISTTGLPVAVSRMISQAQALDNYAQIRKIYSVSMKVFLTIGIVGTLIMLVFCNRCPSWSRRMKIRGRPSRRCRRACCSSASSRPTAASSRGRAT